MTGQLYYPRANASVQRFDDDYAGIKWTGAAEKGCLHTTETTSWPGYGGGKTAPNFTVRPNFNTRTLEWRQHFPANMSARALQNDLGGVETNRDKVIQVEIVGTCDPGAHKRWSGTAHLYTPEAPEWFLEAMAHFFVWCYEEHGIPLLATPEWLPYPKSYGNSVARMGNSEFNSFRGWLGHQHVAENDHGDPGALNVQRIINIAKGVVPTASGEQEFDMWLQQADGSNDQWYLCSVVGKRPISDGHAGEFKAAGVPVAKQKVSASALSVLPNLALNQTTGGETFNQMKRIDTNTTPG